MRGIFLDGCVSGLDYRTQTHKGQLDEGGWYEYEAGESILFSHWRAGHRLVSGQGMDHPLWTLWLKA